MPEPPLPLPAGITSRYIRTNDLTFHVLEAGRVHNNNRPLIILLHGFPEIAYSWRHVLPKLAAAGFHAVAPDQRGFGRTVGWDTRGYSSADVGSFSLTSLVRDVVLLVYALGYRAVRSVVGHDCGAMAAAMCALARPDFFQSVVLMSHPFNGSPDLPFGTADDLSGGALSEETGPKEGEKAGERGEAGVDIHTALAQIGRKHYKWYYSTASANTDMSSLSAPELYTFLRGYFHLKSGSWPGNQHPHPLREWSAPELAKMPGYYIMPVDATMPAAVARDITTDPTQGQASQSWLPDAELAVYAAEYRRTGFQGGLNWYRVRTTAGGRYSRDVEVFAGKKIESPCAFISGKLDWGIYQEPGALERMRDGVSCADLRILRLLDGVGHWTPQESPDEVVRAIVDLVGGLDRCVE
ncbi:hypothetical protein NUU61_002292 [Penicillium alfredii]|uniref:AB hydrolase-1 domain-containing protein n=1 Tax=Penicillium alfredii TaxID=1506179 RepID=A0A9W9FS06_9EURO|nr:uncharacterized protein NUU61_002292 [Penicillium alfredii]KAJ5104945.1 hypothetical protein NUU61_002292 [Penicillium alfredii]